MDADIERAAARAGLAALLRSGCSTSTDHHYVFPQNAKNLLEVEIEAARELHARFHPCRGSMDLGRSDGGLPPDEVTEDRDAILAACAEAIDRFHDPAPDAMVRVALAPCSPFSVTKELMAETATFAREKGVRLHTHMAETLDEEAFCLELFGVRPVEYLEELGWLGDDVWLAHCVHLDEREIMRFGETGTGVAHCPSSNARLGAGIAPVAALTAAGAPVGLGVDGPASNEAGELGGELRQALLMARAAGGPQALTAREALTLGTIHGARCLGRDAEIGSLEPGKLADVALWRLDGVDHAGHRRPGGGARARPAPARRHAAGRRPAGDRGRPPDDRRRGRARPRPGRASRKLQEVRGVTVEAPPRGGIGESVRRPDGIPKVKGDFAYSSDLWADGMLWGATLRSPHPRARIREIDLAPALAVRGVHAVLTHDDVPGRKTYGLEIPDQPVLAIDQVRYQGEPIAIVAADHPETARRAAAQIEVEFEPLDARHRSRAGRRRRPAPPRRQPPAPRAHRARRPARARPTSSSPASTRSACRTRPSSARSPASRCRPRTAASTSSSPPSGCTSTATRWPPASTCRRRRSGSRSAAWAARSAPARTSRCRSTPACSPSTPASR